jgi:glycosyltransferase involved in cell wall biosynthesis
MEARLLVRAGYRVTVVTSGVQYMTGEDIRPYKAWCTEESVEGIRIIRTWAPKDHRRSLFRRAYNYLAYTALAGLVSVLKVHKVDRVFAGTDPILMMPVVHLISMIKRAYMVMDERDLYPETAIALGVMKQGVLSNIIFHIQQFFRHQAIGILAATPGIKKRLLNYGVPERKVHLLYNADVFLNEDIEAGQSIGSLRKLSNRSFLVGYVGGLGRANDIPTLLRAAERLKGLEQVGFVIVGSGEMRESYMDFCRQKELGNVMFLPAVPRKQARALIKQMDICAQPLLKDGHFSSTLTSKTFDYHGLGKPMIFCGQGDTVNLLQETGGGLAVPSEDDEALAEAIRKLAKDDSLRERMGTSARQWYERNIETGAACALMKKAMENHASV